MNTQEEIRSNDHVIYWWGDGGRETEEHGVSGDDLDLVLNHFDEVIEPVSFAKGFFTSKDGTYVMVTVTRSEAQKGERVLALFTEMRRRAQLIVNHTVNELKAMNEDNLRNN